MKNTLRSALYEYYEMIENTLHKSCTQKRQICYLEVPSPDVNAFAAPFKNQSNIFVIGVHDGLLYSLYNGIMVEKRLAKIITRIKNEYSVIEKDEDIYRMVYITSALICFYHEFGHIFNGHLLEYNKNNSNLILQERSAHEAPTGIPINERNMIEFDADSLAGICIGPLTEFIRIDCSERKEDLYKELILISALYFFNELNIHVSDNDDEYPPIAIRIFTVTHSFLVSNDFYIKHGSLPDTDIVINDEILSKYDTRRIISEVNSCLEPYTQRKIDYSKEKIDKWWNTYNKTSHILVKIHEHAKKHFA